MIDDAHIEAFRETVWDYYRLHGRELPWRQPDPSGRFDPYAILVSEIMLQQTQVSRVIPKYTAFLEVFPRLEDLAAAEPGTVIRAWSGLGYNRRAKFLWQAADKVINEFSGALPTTITDLQRLPGVGFNTAAAIMAYAYNQPVVFVETNIRTVFIHDFFSGIEQVSDKQLLPYIEAALDREHPREWYWALMDYGSHLKSQVGNLSRLSSHYVRQSAFAGSRRQLRGAVLRHLGAYGNQSLTQLQTALPDDRLAAVLDELIREDLIRQVGGGYQL